MSDAPPRIRYAAHAVERMAERGISTEQVEQVIDHPAQTLPDGTGRIILQGPIELHGKTLLLRVVTFMNEELGVRTLTVISAIPARMGRYGSQ